MTKNEKTQLILKALANGGYNWLVLSGIPSRPNHVRVKGFGDVWPSTGTYSIGKKVYRKDVDGLLKRLGSDKRLIPNKKPSEGKRIKDLEEYVAFLEQEIQEIKSFLNI